MRFTDNEIYHIYNRGNNKQTVFFKRENYLYFLRKVRKHLMPHCGLLAYCLMPNHFHFLVYTSKNIDGVSKNRPINKEKSQHPISMAIAVILRSYTRAIQKQQNVTGSVFQQKTKAKALNSSDENYPFICFNYIHQNPMRAGLVKRLEDWEFSSFRDYAGLRSGTLCNCNLAMQLIGFDENKFMEESYAVIDEAHIERLW
ncbi:MAG: hypothetical protein WD048_16030 [Chitinophagales bacterium]